MEKEEGINEIKYRLAVLYLQSLLEKQTITSEQYETIKIQIIKKYNPMIGGLDLNE